MQSMALSLRIKPESSLIDEMESQQKAAYATQAGFFSIRFL